MVSGYNSCIHEIQRGKVYLVLLTNDLKENTKDSFEELAASRNIPLCYYGSMELLAEMTGIEGRGVFAVTDRELALAIEKEAKKENVATEERSDEK